MLIQSQRCVQFWGRLMLKKISRDDLWRMSMVALWIQEQSQGRTRLAIVGLPRRLGHRFQLIVAATQYRGPERPNILRLDYPPMRIDEMRLPNVPFCSSVRTDTSGSGDGVSESSGGGGGSSSGVVPGGRGRAADCDAAGNDSATSTASKRTLVMADAKCSTRG